MHKSMGLCWLGVIAAVCIGSRGQAATLTALAVAVNDEPIAPTASVTISPGDSVTCEFYLAGWDNDFPQGPLKTYQVTIDGLASYRSGTAGRLEPLGWDVLWPLSCTASDECPAATPECAPMTGMCGCATSESCPTDYPTCAHSLCIGPDHVDYQAAFVDVNRSDFAHFGLDAVTASQPAFASLATGWGSVALIGHGPLDTGGQVYAGTYIVRASEDACGTFTLSVRLSDYETFLLLFDADDPANPFIAVPTFEPLTIAVEADGTCDAPLTVLQSYFPPRGVSLVRTHMNTISLVFDKPVVAPGAGQITIMELTNDVCAGVAGPDLSDQFEFTAIDDQVGLPRLHIVDPVKGILQHARWYRIENAGGWAGVEPFHVDVRFMIGEFSGDGVVTFADLGAVRARVPTGPSGMNDANRRHDVNVDGVITFADMGTVNQYNPTPSFPHPCP